MNSGWSGLYAGVTVFNGRFYFDVACQYWTLFRTEVTRAEAEEILQRGAEIDARFPRDIPRAPEARPQP